MVGNSSFLTAKYFSSYDRFYDFYYSSFIHDKDVSGFSLSNFSFRCLSWKTSLLDYDVFYYTFSLFFLSLFLFVCFLTFFFSFLIFLFLFFFYLSFFLSFFYLSFFLSFFYLSFFLSFSYFVLFRTLFLFSLSSILLRLVGMITNSLCFVPSSSQ